MLPTMTRGIRTLALAGALAAMTAAPLDGVPVSTEHDLWFPIGERLEYKLYWGFLPVGRAWFEAVPHKLGARDCIALRARARTNKIVALIFPVDDEVESIVDAETFLPIRYHQRLHEGDKKRDELVLFDHDDGKAYWEDLKTHELRIIEIEDDTRDVLTLTYAMRKTGLDVDETAHFRVLVDDKLYDLECTALERDSVTVGRYGRVPCIKIEPKARFGEIFMRKGQVFLWFTDDARRLCTRMTALLPFADLKAVLDKVEGPGDDRWVHDERD